MGYWFNPLINNTIIVPYPIIPSPEIKSQQNILAKEDSKKNLGDEKVKPSLRLKISREDLMENGYKRNLNLWTKEEDTKLKILAVQENKNWREVAKKLGSRNAKMCYDRFRRINYRPKKQWTPQEEKITVDYVSQNGKKWKKIENLL